MTTFHINAQPNSPIWGTAGDMLKWLSAWYDSYQVTLKDLENVTPELEMEIYSAHLAGATTTRLMNKYKLPARVIFHIVDSLELQSIDAFEI